MWCSVYPVSSQWHLECGKWRWCWLFLLLDTRAGEMRPGAEHSSPDNGYNGSPVMRGDKWMIAGDISSWAEGGASRCHTVTPPAQTSISSGQDFITLSKNPKPFFIFFRAEGGGSEPYRPGPDDVVWHACFLVIKKLSSSSFFCWRSDHYRILLTF